MANNSTSHPKADTALAVSRSILNNDWKQLDSLLAPDFRYHGDLGETYSRDEYIGFMQAMRKALSDMTMDFTHVVSDGDLVSVRFVTKAQQTGKFMGAPATKKNVEIRGIFMRRVLDDQIAEEWQATDLLWMMTQMGFATLMGYSVASGLFHRKTKIPARVE